MPPLTTTMTANGGQYAFAGLAEGTYVLNMTNPDADAYIFEDDTRPTIVLGDAESNITNFEGTHTRTASISGMLFIDEVMQDNMLTMRASLRSPQRSRRSWRMGCWTRRCWLACLANAKVIVRGPRLNDPPMVSANPGGRQLHGRGVD